MANSIKNQEGILAKLNIHQLNPMQDEAITAIKTHTNTILLSPTGTGKTLAFSLPLLDSLDPESNEIQALILVPSRELAIQIEQVIRSMGSGYKVNAVYGGRPMSKDKIELKHTPAILIGTPGRVADHFSNDRFSKKYIKTIILDEFDKSLEVGFEYEMRGIINELPSINKRILTSATQGVEIPDFVGLDSPETINYLGKSVSKLKVKTVISPAKNKLNTLLHLLNHIGNATSILNLEERKYLLNTTVKNLKTYLKITRKQKFAKLITNAYTTKTGGIVFYDWRNITRFNNLKNTPTKWGIFILVMVIRNYSQSLYRSR